MDVDSARQGDLLRYLDELSRWNRRHNLTAIRDRKTAIETHLVDSLTLLPYLPADCRLLDFGSGAGLPGLPLRIARPDLQLTSLDAVGKKLAFQRHLARLLELSNIRFVHDRLETFAAEADHRSFFERVIFRAVGEIEHFAPLVAPVLKPGGELIAMKGPEGMRDWTQLRLAPLPGFDNKACLRLSLPASSAERTLIFLKKQ